MTVWPPVFFRTTQAATAIMNNTFTYSCSYMVFLYVPKFSRQDHLMRPAGQPASHGPCIHTQVIFCFVWYFRCGWAFINFTSPLLSHVFVNFFGQSLLWLCHSLRIVFISSLHRMNGWSNARIQSARKLEITIGYQQSYQLSFVKTKKEKKRNIFKQFLSVSFFVCSNPIGVMS